MANLRELKKDIDNRIFEIISDCFIFSGLHPEVKPEHVAAIVEEAVSLRNELIARVNKPGHEGDPKLVKGYFRAIKSDLLSGTDGLCKKLSEISGKRKK